MAATPDALAVARSTIVQNKHCSDRLLLRQSTCKATYCFTFERYALFDGLKAFESLWAGLASCPNDLLHSSTKYDVQD